jgi:hypothetical protein
MAAGVQRDGAGRGLACAREFRELRGGLRREQWRCGGFSHRLHVRQWIDRHRIRIDGPDLRNLVVEIH